MHYVGVEPFLCPSRGMIQVLPFSIVPIWETLLEFRCWHLSTFFAGPDVEGEVEFSGRTVSLLMPRVVPFTLC